MLKHFNMLAHNHMTVTSKQLDMLKLLIILYVEGYSLVPVSHFIKGCLPNLVTVTQNRLVLIC